MEKVIRKIDPSLTYIRQLKPASLLVFEVEREGSRYVLKTTESDYKYGVDHLDWEAELLGLADGVKGITHLVQKYRHTDGYRNPLLKEFYEGQSIYELYKLGVKIYDVNIQTKIENTVRDLHSLGIVGLDLRTTNIIISPDRQDACLVDFEFEILPDHVGSSELEKLKARDFLWLEDSFE